MGNFWISAGKYEEFKGQTIRNVKVSLHATTREEAERIVDEQKLRSYPWWEIEDADEGKAARGKMPETKLMNFILEAKHRTCSDFKNALVKEIEKLKLHEKYTSMSRLHITDDGGASMLNDSKNVYTVTDNHVIGIRIGYGSNSSRPTLVVETYKRNNPASEATMIFRYPEGFVSHYRLMTQFNQKRFN